VQFLLSQRTFDEEKRILSWGREKVFVRNSYQAIADLILASASNPVSFNTDYVYGLFGSPGVGKTYFIYYFFHRLMTAKPNCLLIWATTQHTLIFNPQNSQFLSSFANIHPSQIYEVIDINIGEKSFNHENYQYLLTHFHLFVTSGLPNSDFDKFAAPLNHREFMPTW
jgi:hypothetical protein